jgi:thiamine-phosphate pyrophosphorylase
MRPVLCLVTDRHLASAPLEETVERAVAGGVDWVQVRERDLEGAPLLALVDALRAAARRGAGGRPVRVVVNRRADVAWAAGVEGVHLGWDALPSDRARALLGAGAWIGVSAHAPEDVQEAARAGASYAHLAPVFAPISKPTTRPPLGLEALARAAGAGIPVLAQGGIEAANAASAVCAGAAGVAVTGAILGSPDPEAAARALRQALGPPDDPSLEPSR